MLSRPCSASTPPEKNFPYLFRILPSAPGPPLMHAQLLEQPQARKNPPAQPRRILIVDDDDAMVDVLGQRLGRQGFEVLVAASGEEGLAMARRRRPNLVLLDLRLPDA